MRVYEIAKELGTKSNRIIECLADLGIAATHMTKLDSRKVKQVRVLVLDPARVEDVAKVLGLSVDKLLDKSIKIGLPVISHLSLLGYDDRLKLLRIKNLDKLKIRRKKLEEDASLRRRKQRKLKRVYEVAAELGVSEKALLRRLQKMHVFAVGRRSPLESQVIKKLKQEHFNKADYWAFRYEKFKERLIEADLELDFMPSAKVIIATIIILLVPITLNFVASVSRLRKQKYWEVTASGFKKSTENYQLLETVALMEIAKTGDKLSVVEEGISQPSVAESLVHKSNSPLPGNQGESVLMAPKAGVEDIIKKLAAGDALMIKLINEKKLYYQVKPVKQVIPAAKTSLKSTLVIKDSNGKVLVRAILQKQE